MNNKIFAITAISTLILLLSCSGDEIIVNSDNNPNQISDIKPILKVYIENSGSMDGYMCDGSQLKDAIFDYVSDLSTCVDTTQLYYINNRVIPYHADLEQYIKTMNPITFQKAGGNRSNSDLSKMLSTVLDAMTDSTVSIFVSDCILDLPVSDAQRFLSTCQISIKNTINKGRKNIPLLGVEILKMKSDFNGKYFYQNGGSEVLTNVKRPYYIWIFGNSNVLAKLNTEVLFKGLEKYGYDNIISYCPKTSIPYDITNRALISKTINPIKGDYNATIRADFCTTLQSEDVLLNLDNYSFNNQNLIIENIKPIIATEREYSHFINITIPKGVNIAEDYLILKAPNMPSWVLESNDESGENVKGNLDKTTGIKYLIGGVSDAYKKDNVLTTVKFTVKRK